MLAKVVQKLAAKVPDHGNWAYAAQAAVTAALAIPGVGVISRMVQPASVWLPGGSAITEVGLGLVTVGMGSLILSKVAAQNQWRIAQNKKRSRKMEITLGGMTFDEKALFTNLLAFGAIGSGKTASVIYPILDAITGLYKNDDPNEPDAKWGGFILDVKGDFHAAVIYVMQKHGRDLLEDLVVIRPDNDYYILEFEEVNTRDHFLVSCMGGTSLQECDIVLETATGPENILAQDMSGNKVLLLPSGDRETLSSFMFSDRGTFRRPEIHQLLIQLEFNVAGKSVRWLGWREDKSGKLTRVSHTHQRQIVYAKGVKGTQASASKPVKLRYLGVHSINNGLTYNLISKSAASTEAAGRIMSVAEVTGNSFGSDNAYWSNASEKHIAHCIELFRQVEGPMGRECSVNEIQKFTTNEPYLVNYLSKLKDVIRNKQTMGASDFEIILLRNLEDYFEGEWMRHDPKTKGNIQSCVTNLFGDITRNEQLLKTFCQPSRFSFEDCLNQGKVYTLVLSAYPNAQMLIGTGMKLDFQQVVLKRTQAALVNKQRFLMFLADEYQYFITTSGCGGKSGGDEKFLSVARQSRIFNLISTQAKTSLLAVQRDENKIDAFIQCFGSRVFLQNLDEKTNKLAEQNFGQIWAERTDFSGPDLKLTSAFGEMKSGHVSRRKEKQNRFDASHFSQMAPFEAVIFNKERPTGKKMVKANLASTACFFDQKELARAANDYYQAYIENRAHHLGLGHLFDLKDNIKLENPHEKEQRRKGILRSWRNGLPIGMATPTETTASGTVTSETQTQGEEAGMDEAEMEVTASEEMAHTREQMAKDLGTAPKPEELFDYVAGDNKLFSDLEASRQSDPFYNAQDDKIIVPPQPAEAAGPASPTNDWEKELSKNLQKAGKGAEKAVTPTPLKRVMANLTNVPDGIKAEE